MERGEQALDWRRSSYGMAAVVFIAFFGFNFVMPILPLYVRELGVTEVSQAALVSGLMLGIAPLLAAFFSPLWGLVADRYGRKRMVQRAMLVMVGATLLMALVSHAWQLFLLRAAIGVFGGFTAMAMAYTVTVTPPERSSEALGLLQAAQMGGVIVGPFCAGLLADALGIRATFVGGAAMVLLGCIVLTVLTADDRAVTGAAQRSRGTAEGNGRPTGIAALRAAAQLPGFLGVMVVLFLCQVVDRSFAPVLPLYVAELGTPAAQVASYAGLIVSVAAAGTAVSAAVLGRLAARIPAQRIMLGTLAAGMVLCLPLAAVQSPLQLLALRVLLGVFAGGSITLAYSRANAVVPADGKGAAFGVLSSTSLLGSAVSPLAMGALTAVDLRAVFIADAALYAAALLASLTQRRLAPQAG
ncbi:MAG TPA: MFS transporter [Chloroflexota bacterium]|nr:MFS transporter [Chloroflexota bacterium]